MQNLNIVEVDWEAQSAACVAIRRAVFVEEQSVPDEIEIDGLDPECRQFLAVMGGRPIATARLKSVPEGVKIQRVAVLKDARGTGVGHALMRVLMQAAEPRPMLLDAQTGALPFYEKLGFVAEGAVFMDAGIPHLRMRKITKGTAE